MLKPFHFWCQKVLPLVFDDSLSYYEVLCKLTRKINELIQYIDMQIHALYDWVTDEIREIKDGAVGYTRYLSGKKVLLVCDASTYNATAYQDIVDVYGAEALAVVNIGATGYAQTNATDTNSIVTAITPYSDYDTVFLMVGQYDYIQQEEMGTLADFAKQSRRNVAAGLGWVLSRIMVNFNPNAETFVVTPLCNRTSSGDRGIGLYNNDGHANQAAGQKAYELMMINAARHFGARVIHGYDAPNFTVFQTHLYNRWCVPAVEPYCCQPTAEYIKKFFVPFIVLAAHAQCADMLDICNAPINWNTGGKSTGIIRMKVSQNTVNVLIRMTGHDPTEEDPEPEDSRIVTDGTNHTVKFGETGFQMCAPIFYQFMSGYLRDSSQQFYPVPIYVAKNNTTGLGEFSCVLRNIPAGKYEVFCNGSYVNNSGQY